MLFNFVYLAFGEKKINSLNIFIIQANGGF